MNLKLAKIYREFEKETRKIRKIKEAGIARKDLTEIKLSEDEEDWGKTEKNTPGSDK